MIDYLKRLFTYDDWANREVLDALTLASGEPPRVVKLMGHIIAAERLWLERLRSQKQSLPVWPELDIAQCQFQNDDLSWLWQDYLTSIDESALDRAVAYTNSKGEKYNNRVEDILTHVIMHSAYHRGQIAGHMRAAGFTPAYTDFIHGVRQGKVVKE
jgi:uncharacterized damage-inducible protein DinB